MFSSEGYDALLHGTAIVGRSDRGVLRLSGADRAAWLQGLITNDVHALQPGRRLYSAYLTPQGRMITDLWLVEDGETLLVDVPATLTSALCERLDALVFAEDVRIDDVSATVPCSMVVGARLPGDEGTAGAEGPGLLVADATYGRPALVAYGDLDRLLASHGLASLGDAPRADLETFEVVRIEAGVPRFLADLTEETIPLEAGIEGRAISFTKGCYVGQEIIVRVTQRGGGRVAKRLIGLTADSAALAGPPKGQLPIQAGGRSIGRVTSAAVSPRLGRAVALGYVHRDFVAPGTPVEILDGVQSIPAVVAALPFVDPLA